MQVFTDETYTLQNLAVVSALLLWFVGWNVAAKRKLVQANEQRRNMVNVAAAEILAEREAASKGTKKSR
jgi:hypothetical protein